MPVFDPELYYTTGTIDLHATDVREEDALGAIGAQAPVVLHDQPGEEQFITVLPVSMPNENGNGQHPSVQVFECDLGCATAFSMCLSPENALRLAQALTGAAILALDGEYTATVQERVNKEVDR